MLRRALVLAIATCALAPAAAGAADPPAAIPATSGWSYKPDPDDGGLAAGWQDGQGAGWLPVSVPHAFPATFGPGGEQPSVGWYRLRFQAPETPGYDWAVRFEEVRRQARVWLDGREIGADGAAFVPFELPLAGLRPGAETDLVVRVANVRPAEEGWWNWGGIVRPVSLVPRGRVAMQDLGLMTRMRCARCRPSVLVETDVVNRTDQPLSPVVDVSLRSPDGVLTSALHGAGSLGSGERRRVRFAVPIRGHVRLWSPGHPALYRALVRATVGDRVEQSERRSVGLRLVQVRHGRLYLNGRRLNARGASFHEDLPGQGAALDDSGLDRIFRDLRRLHAQVVRAHYLISQPLLDRFDRAGILVWSEAPNWQNDDLLRDPAGRAHALDLVRRTVVEARSHPSVFVHSVANELCLFAGRSYPAGSRTFLRDAVGVARGADPTLPVATTFNLPNPPCRDAYRYFDVLGDNAYLGWYGNAPVRTFRHRLDFLRRRYRRQALVVSEFGAEAFRNGPAGEKGTYGFQKRWAKAALDVLDRIPYLSSALYWTSREFRIDAGWCGGACRGAENTLHQKGLFSYDGTLKPAGALVAARFARWRPLR